MAKKTIILGRCLAVHERAGSEAANADTITGESAISPAGVGNLSAGLGQGWQICRRRRSFSGPWQSASFEFALRNLVGALDAPQEELGGLPQAQPRGRRSGGSKEIFRQGAAQGRPGHELGRVASLTASRRTPSISLEIGRLLSNRGTVRRRAGSAHVNPPEIDQRPGATGFRARAAPCKSAR